MSTQFEFHLMGADAPHGELEADQLLSIVTSLKEVATKIGRLETNAAPLGRAPDRVHRVARLLVGLEPGSTTVRVHRAGDGAEALPFDLEEEQAFDATFASVVEALATDSRPDWMSDSLSRAAEQLVVALQRAAPEVDFVVDGASLRRFRTGALNREIWQVAAAPGDGEMTFVGRLYAVNLRTHRLEVQDDAGHRVRLPHVRDDAGSARLLGSHVLVRGVAEVDAQGRTSQIHDAVIEAAPDPLGSGQVAAVVPIDEILRSAPGPDLGGGIELDDDEFGSFLAAVRG